MDGERCREHATVYLGDDETDEDAFEAIHGKALTMRVGRDSRPTAPARRLPGVSAVLRFLITLAGGERP